MGELLSQIARFAHIDYTLKPVAHHVDARPVGHVTKL